METGNSSELDNGLGNNPYLGTWARIYLHGAIAFVVLYALAYLVTLLVPIFEITGSKPLAVLLSILAILFVPPLLGSIVLFGIIPLLGKREGWRDLNAWDKRLYSQLSSARQNAQIVIINWPNKEVRTMGIMTATFTADASGQRQAAVYVPSAPQTRYGYIRVVPVADVELTDLTLREFQLYQLAFGAFCPDHIGVGNGEE